MERPPRGPTIGIVSSRDLGVRVGRRFQRQGVTSTGAKIEQLVAYLWLLAKWNAKINLTALPVDPPTDQAIDRLLVEPFLAARHVSKSDRLVIDLGSGGGSPGIPLKIAVPSLRLVMVEAKVRKSAFLREVVRQLSLEGAEVVNARFEELLTRVDLHESANLVTVRAVRADQRLWGTAQAFLRPGGRIFWFTSADGSRAAVLPPLSIESTEPLVPATASHLTILRKHS